MAIKRWNASTSQWELVGTPGTVTPAAIGAAALSGGNSFTGNQAIAGELEASSLITSRNGLRVNAGSNTSRYQLGPFYNFTDFQITHSTDNFASHTPRLTIDTSGNLMVGNIAQLGGQKFTLSGGISATGSANFYYHNNIPAHNGIYLGTADKATSPSGSQGTIAIMSNDSSNALAANISLVTSPTGSQRRLAISCLENNVAWRDVTIAETSGSLLVGYSANNNSAYKLQVNSQIFATSSSIATSDGRYKENVLPITSGLDIIDSLNPVSFNWKEHAVHNFPEGKTVGFIAQEVQEALSDYEWVDNIIKSNYNEEADEEFLGIAESNIIPLLVAAVKELRSELNTLKASML